MLGRIIFCFSLAFIATTTACQFNPPARDEFDLSMYAGRWYLIQTGPLNGDNGPIHCVYEEYVATESPFVYDFVWSGQFENGTVVPDSGWVTMPDPANPAHLEFFIDTFVFHSKIVATDYESWGLEYTCNEEIPYERFMIRSRERTLDDKVLETIKALIDGFGADAEDFATTVHSNCVN